MATKQQLELVEDFLRDSAEMMRDIMRNDNMNASGQSSNTMDFKLNKDGGTLFGPTHLLQLEQGRGPTRGGKGSGPSLQERILRWINDKGIVPRPDDNGRTPTIEGLSWGISKAIHNKGTVRHQRSQKSGIISKVLTDKRLDKLLGDVADIALEETATNIFSSIKEINK